MNTIMNFTVKSLQELSKGNRNTLFSPVSALAVLAILRDGAGGRTRSQLERFLRAELKQILEDCFKGYNSNDEKNLTELLYKAAEQTGKLEELRRMSESERLLIVRKSLEKAASQINFVNAILVKDDEEICINEDFAKKYEDTAFAEFIKTEFNAAACDKLNRWVRDKTKGHIENAIDEFPKDTALCVLNALAFEGAWENEFDIVRNMKFKFNGKESEVEFLCSQEDWYIEDENAAGFMKPYEDGKYSFVALLPNKEITLDEYISTLDAAKLRRLLEAHEVEVNIAFPKLMVEDELDLKQALNNLGIADVFDAEKADFSCIATISDPDMKLFIDSLMQKTKLELDEKGTRASALTMSMMTNCLSSIQPKKAVFNRPFLYMIIENDTKLPIFIGTVKTDEVLCQYK